tara:strand:+ start:5329 stop:5493 length:165 start_codon:yes stop_codon:yes gene_type:complete
MPKLVECPNCLGTTEELYKGKYPRTCHTCKGEGMVDEIISDAYINSLNYYNEEY